MKKGKKRTEKVANQKKRKKKRNNKKKKKKANNKKKEKSKKNASESWVEVAQRTREPRRARFRGVVARGDARRVGRAGDGADEEERRQRARAKERACASREGPGSRRLKFFLKNVSFLFCYGRPMVWPIGLPLVSGPRREKKGQRRPQTKEKRNTKEKNVGRYGRVVGYQGICSRGRRGRGTETI
jgi:hypothetical protein